MAEGACKLGRWMKAAPVDREHHINAQLTDVGLFASADRYGDLCVHGIIDLRRSFSRDEVERAVQATVDSFPVLGCVYEPRFFRDRWVRTNEPLSSMVHFGVVDDVETDTAMWTERTLDATRVRPLRVVVLPMPEGCRLIVSLSHWAVDGAGMAAVGHVLCAHLRGVRPALPVEPRRDLRRTLDGLSLRHLPMLGRDMFRAMLHPLRVAWAAPRERPYARSGSKKPSSRQVVIEASTVAAIEAHCGTRIKVNDLLIAIVAMVTAKRSRSRPIAVLYTMDLRRYSRTPHLSATNASAILTTVVPRAATDRLADAVKAVRAITQRQQRSFAGPAFLLVPMLMTGATPHGVVRRFLPALHMVAVDLPASRGLVFTNVGKLDQGLGPLVDDIVDVRAVGPNIKGVAAPAIIAFGLRGRIHLELFAPPGLGEVALDELEGELREVLATANGL